MSISPIIFIFFGIIISIVDYKKMIIPDKIIIPATLFLLIAKYFENSLHVGDIVGAFIVVSVFLIPIILNMAFGGGDLRFGFFCALFVGLKGIGYFILLSAILHVAILKLTKKEVFGFAPAMSLGAIFVYGGLNFL